MNKPKGLHIHMDNDAYIFWTERKTIADDVEMSLGVW
jgi:hypothetical protein